MQSSSYENRDTHSQNVENYDFSKQYFEDNILCVNCRKVITQVAEVRMILSISGEKEDEDDGDNLVNPAPLMHWDDVNGDNNNNLRIP